MWFELHKENFSKAKEQMKWEGIIKSILKILGQLVYETCLVHQANYGS